MHPTASAVPVFFHLPDAVSRMPPLRPNADVLGQERKRYMLKIEGGILMASGITRKVLIGSVFILLNPYFASQQRNGHGKYAVANCF